MINNVSTMPFGLKQPSTINSIRRPKNLRYETKSFALALNTGCPRKNAS